MPAHLVWCRMVMSREEAVVSPADTTKSWPCANASLVSFPWCDRTKPFSQRAALLAAELSPQEQATQLSTFSFTSNHSGYTPGVPRVRLPAYGYHTEGLHGVRDACDSPATLWPQVVAMAATGNLKLMRAMGKTSIDYWIARF